MMNIPLGALKQSLTRYSEDLFFGTPKLEIIEMFYPKNHRIGPPSICSQRCTRWGTGTSYQWSYGAPININGVCNRA